MRSDRGVFSYLVEHFFRRFFDNDTLQTEGDTQTSVVRAIAIVAVPGLMFSFWLQNAYPQRTMWGAIEDQYFFVLFSFVVMGIVAIFEWEMLFPDRLDFLILSPMSIRPWQMLGAKATALGGFVGLFLVGCNLCGMLIMPAITTHVVRANGQARIVGDFWRQLAAHAAAVSMAGLFAALLFIAIGGVLLCVLSARQFRVVSPVVQTVSVMALVLLLLGYLQYGDAMQELLSGRLGWMRWEPTLWFLAVYERLLRGDAAPAFAQQLSAYAYRAVGISAAVALATYPLAWARMRRMAIEGGASRRGEPPRWIASVMHSVVREPGERAVFHFIGQTITRNNQVPGVSGDVLRDGAGVCSGVRSDAACEGQAGWALSQKGLHALMPLLVFWTVAGLRAAFAFPLNLAAAWVYRVTRVTNAAMNECAEAASRWALMCASGCGGVCRSSACRLRMGCARSCSVQVVCGVCALRCC